MTKRLVLAHNVLNSDRLKRDLESFVSTQGCSDAISKWVMGNVMNYLKSEEYPNFERIKNVRFLPNYGYHSIPDWLKKARSASGDVKDLVFVVITPEMRSNIEHAIGYLKEQEAAGHKDFARRNAKEVLALGHEWFRDKIKQRYVRREGTFDVLFTSAPFTFVSITSPEGLEYEGESMGHCVGFESMQYKKDLQSGELLIVSLRDKQNKPHCTMEIRHRALNQCRGKGNRGVVERYRPALAAFFKSPWFREHVKNVRQSEIKLNLPQAVHLTSGAEAIYTDLNYMFGV